MPGSVLHNSSHPETHPFGAAASGVKARSRRAFRMPMLEQNDIQQIKQKALRFHVGLVALFDAWQCPTLAWGDPTLPSALRRFTSEFGMGSGGTTALLPPGKFCIIPTATLAAIETNLGTR